MPAATALRAGCCRQVSTSKRDTQNLSVPLPREHLHQMLTPVFSSFQRSFLGGSRVDHSPGKKCGYFHLHHSLSASAGSLKRRTDIPHYLREYLSAHPSFQWDLQLTHMRIKKTYVPITSGIL